jgi:hypothetical protein
VRGLRPRPVSCGGALAFQVIEHLEAPGVLVSALARCLRSEGFALVTTPNGALADGVNPYHVREYRAQELADVLRAGFVAFDVWPPLPQLVAGVLIVAVVGAIPVAVAGLGTTQAAFVYLFHDYAPRETLLAMSLILTLGLLTLRAGMGMLFAREFTREALLETRSAA